MAFLRLSNIGKIYVSEGNVTVGIRGVNLSFEKGEFVAITGESGSGKSTLLNVLSGMDTYEEGELYIEEQSTSHYLQPDWEEYREQYISFIFQNYNILESFTVLQNVELALMTISDPIERRKRAIELIERVGLKKHMRQKGSQLSGGQKQRTVIARALAKDSPIILADEPTGNLDSQTSREIIALLREVSKDKLLIMVTHSYDQVSEFATRHIRVYDGAVESDQVITEPETKEYPEEEKKGKASVLSNGLLLGRSIFFAKPKLSTFLCFLLLIGTFGVFLITMFCGDAQLLFEKNYMFRPMEGRLVITSQDGSLITEEQLKGLADKYGAKRSTRYDYLYDMRLSDLTSEAEDSWYEYEMDQFHNGEFYLTCGDDFGTPDIGRYPEKPNEMFLRLPLFYQQWYGTDSLLIDHVTVGESQYPICGIKYITDNTQDLLVLMTEEGFETLSTFVMMQKSISLNKVSCDGTDRSDLIRRLGMVCVDPYIDPDKIYYSDPVFLKTLKAGGDVSAVFRALATYEADYLSDDRYTFMTFGKDTFLAEDPRGMPVTDSLETTYCRVGIRVAKQLCEPYLQSNYHQASLFFDSDRQAKNAAKGLRDDGYITATSKTTYSLNLGDIIGMVFAGFLYLIIWILGITFIAFFINMCTNRTVGAFSEDIAIMRSMGIPVKVIRVGIYVRMLICIVPSLILLPVVAWLIYHYPRWNGRMRYLQPWQYVVILAGMMFLTVRVTRKQIKNLFGTSVKKSLRGGEEE